MTDLLVNSIQITVILVLIVLTAVLQNYLELKKKEIKDRITSNKINEITLMVELNIRQLVDEKMIRFRSAWNAGKHIKDGAPQDSAKTDLLQLKQDVSNDIYDITPTSVISFMHSEHIEDFDDWLKVKIDYFVTLNLDTISQNKKVLDLSLRKEGVEL